MIGAVGGRRRLLRAGAVMASGLAGLAGHPDRAFGSDASRASAPTAWPQVDLLDGGTWSPGSWEGVAGVLVVWATWCPYCHRHNPRVDALHRAVAGRPLRVLGAALDADPETVRRHVRERGYAFPNTMDAEALRTRFGLRRVTPMTVTFDRRGTILLRIPGEMTEADLLALARLADTPA